MPPSTAAHIRASVDAPASNAASTIDFIREWASIHATSEGRSDTLIPGLSAYRFSRRTVFRKEPTFGVTLGLVLQGSKAIRFGAHRFVADPLHYVVVTLAADYAGIAEPASPTRPYLALGLTFAPEVVAKVLAALAEGAITARTPSVPAFSTSLDPLVADALARLLRAADNPAERRALAPLATEELVFRLLQSKAAAALRHALGAADCARIVDAMVLMRARAFGPLAVPDVARQVGMSASHFAHRFRAIARVSPMRYVKEVRLDEARALLLRDSARAGDVAHQVGYESPSHFSRDFKRRFGATPAEYTRRLRTNTFV